MQKKIALINDVTGFGRCSIAVMAPIVSAMKIQAVTVPTAILSTHTQFPIFYFDDYIPAMMAAITSPVPLLSPPILSTMTIWKSSSLL